MSLKYQQRYIPLDNNSPRQVAISVGCVMSKLPEQREAKWLRRGALPMSLSEKYQVSTLS